MKYLSVFIIAIMVGHLALAQKFVPQIGIGTVLNYNVVQSSGGQEIPLMLCIVSLNDPMKVKWALNGTTTGSFLIPEKSLETGDKMRLERPAPDVDTKFKEDETLMFISKAAFADMVNKKAFTLNHMRFKAEPNNTVIQINGKDADVLHATTANSTVELWILNDPKFPLICKLSGNPSGTDFDLTSVK